MDQPQATYRTADQFFGRHPDGSVMAKMVYDLQRTVDLAVTLPGVDAGAIGCAGHSHGAYGTLFGMAFEERIRAGLVSCGFSLLREDSSAERWWRRTALIPRLGMYEGDMAGSPVDFHHLMGLAAPRPLFVAAGLQDAIFPQAGRTRAAIRLARSADERRSLHSWVFDGPHCFPTAARARGYRLLQEALSPPGW